MWLSNVSTHGCFFFFFCLLVVFFLMKNICISNKYAYLSKQGYSLNFQWLCPHSACWVVLFLKAHTHKEKKETKGSQSTTSFNYFPWSYLFLFSELYFHLLVTRLVLANAMSSYKIATDVSQFWILLASFFYQPKNITCFFTSHTSQKNGRQSFLCKTYTKRRNGSMTIKPC